MRQVLEFIRYDISFPKKIKTEKIENIILPNIKKQKHKDIIKKMYIKSDSSDYYIAEKQISRKKKIEITSILLRAGLTNNIAIFIWIVFGIAGVLLIFFVIKSKIHFVRLILLVPILCAGIFYAFTINENVVERVHLIQFAILGFIFAIDNLAVKKFWIILLSIFWCFLIASLDETFQYFLPYRYGHVHDIIFGTLGGLWGTLIYVIAKINIKPQIGV